MQTKRFVFEHGLEIRACDGRWTIYNSDRAQSTSFESSALAIAQLRPLRPVLLTESRNYGSDMTWLLRPGSGRLFAADLSDLTNRPISADTFYAVHHLAYLIEAAGYHCQQLAEHYARLADRFAQIRAIPGADSTADVANFSYDSKPYFEFDALLGVARRAYDSSRYLLWPRFGKGKGSLPRSLPVLLKASSSIPAALHDRLDASWTRFGTLLTDYRDCVHHYVPVDFGLSTAFMRRHSSGAWLTMLRIPDNPQARSKELFTFALNRDALTYAWALVDEILDVAIEVADTTVPRGSAA
jgi:hypothetical protein